VLFFVELPNFCDFDSGRGEITVEIFIWRILKGFDYTKNWFEKF
jgi:hypothetical protein